MLFFTLANIFQIPDKRTALELLDLSTMLLYKHNQAKCNNSNKKVPELEQRKLIVGRKMSEPIFNAG